MGIPKNVKRCLGACSGDYIAFCEGDDYWTDTHKLQKALEFLESHPDYSVCFNAVVMYYESENRYAPHPGQSFLGKDTLTTEDLIEANNICGFSSCMYRASIVRNLPEGIFDIYTVDWMFNMACGRLGKIRFIRDPMSVYRIHAKGEWSGRSTIDQLRDQLVLLDIYDKFFSYEYDEQFRKKKEKINEQYVYEYAKQFGKGDEKVNQSIPYRSNQQVPFVKKCVDLLIRAIRNPRKAYNRLRPIMLNIVRKVRNKYPKDKNTRNILL
jgi:hypothetical protein